MSLVTPLCHYRDISPTGGEIGGSLRHLSAKPQSLISADSISVWGAQVPRINDLPPCGGDVPTGTEGGNLPHTPVPPKARSNARRMRKVMTDAELRLWNELRAHRLMGLGFRRQLPIAGYIVDFACPAERLIVEVDGSQHGNDRDQTYDQIRTRRLEADGWTILRFWNDDVLKDIDNVCMHILIVSGKDKS